MRILIVEDEAVVARRLERQVREMAGDAEIDLAASLGAARERLQRPVDLLFLDLNLGGRDGFELLEEAAASRFQTVIVSAHHDQALRAFEFGVTDFLAKPWSEERLRLAMERVLGRETSARGRTRTLVVRRGRELRSVPVEQIVFIRGADDYSEIHLADGTTHLHEKTLLALEALLPACFARVHRSYIANLEHLRALRTAPGGRVELPFGDETAVPVGRIYRDTVRERLGLAT